MPRPNSYLYAAMLFLIMAVMDLAIVSVSADSSANLTSLSRSKRQLFSSGGGGRQSEDTVNDPSEPCAIQGISYFCYAGQCARDCGVKATRLGEIRAPKYRWCYSTKGATGDQKFVPCTQDTDCAAIWNCATPCEAKPNKPEVSPCQAFGCDDTECWSTCNYGKLEKAICYMRKAQESGGIKCKRDDECSPKVNYRCKDKCKSF